MSKLVQNAEELVGIARSEALKILGGNSGDDYASWAEDIAQDTMLHMFEMQAEGTLRDEEVHGLVKSHAKLKAMNFKSKEQRRREIEEEHGQAINRGLDGSREYTSADPYEVMAYEEMRSRLDELSPKLYNTVEAHYINGLSVPECADLFECSEDVIYKRLQRARDIVTGDNNNE